MNIVIQEGFDNNNSKPFWRYVKAKRQDNVGVAPLKIKGVLYSESKNKAQFLVEQFYSVFTKTGNKVLSKLLKQFKYELPGLTITVPGVEKLLRKVITSKAIGPDNISNVILKECANQLAQGLSEIFQNSIDSGKLPTDWTNAKISPVFKKGDVRLAENYHPVSLTSVTCKLLEHIICKHLLTYLENNNILTNLNHGFCSGYSCDTQLRVTLNDLLHFNDEGSQTDVIILGFSEAFDTWL